MRGKDTKKALSALMVYTGFKVNKTVWLDAQFVKAYDAITNPQPLWAKRAVDGYTELLSKKLDRWNFKHSPLVYEVPSIVATVREKTYGGSLWDPVRSGNGLARALLSVDKTGLSWIPRRYQVEWANQYPTFVAGRIGLIQEKGLKARVVAMPGLLLQSILKPLNSFLLNICKSAPWDYTHDQMAGCIPAQEALKQGKTVHSVDLSSATDRFPYQWQSLVLSYVAPDYQVIMDSVIKHGLWKMTLPKGREIDYEVGSKLISYGCGQPMGLNGSFPLFSLTHGLMLLTLQRLVNPNSKEIPFSILGDDVMIWDDELHNAYRKMLYECDIPVSVEKCMSSNTHAEFASRIITKDHVIRGIRMGVTDRSNILSKIDNFTLEAIRLQDPVVRVWAAVTDLLGGPGYQQGGIPLDPIRSDYALDVLSRLEKDKVVPPTVSLFAKVLRFMTSLPYYQQERTSEIWRLPPPLRHGLSFLTDTTIAEEFYLNKAKILGPYFGSLTPFQLKADVRYRSIAKLIENDPSLVIRADEILGT
jgi:hypothetical protein